MSRSQEKLKKVEDEISEYIFKQLCSCLSLPTFIHTYMYMYVHTHTYAHAHTHILTFTHTHTYTFIHLMLAEEKYKRDVVIIPVDFSDGLKIYPSIAEQLKDLDIGVLSKCP